MASKSKSDPAEVLLKKMGSNKNLMDTRRKMLSWFLFCWSLSLLEGVHDDLSIKILRVKV